MHSYLEIKDIWQTPPLHRFSMVHHPYVPKAVSPQWEKILFLRRVLFFVLVSASTWAAAGMVSATLSSGGSTALKEIIVCMFTVLFGWISITFWTALIGFILLVRKYDPFAPAKGAEGQKYEIPPSVDIAVIMPVYNEDVKRVFTGLQVMYESLRQAGQLERFTFFVLSDSNQAHQGEQEEAAWAALCGKVDGAGRIFYRRRKIRIHKKSGNISDFCRRWGSQYKYMITLDADSLMSGPLMIDMVKAMEARCDIGILQTAPKAINQKSLVSRINQFTSHLYGPLLLAGAHFVQLDEAGFWGHNAIVRMEPFMKFCALPKLSGPRPFGGEILSHDFVEAALMRRAGWGVWLAHGFEDSYEELPPSLLEELERDCRWCRGNIQHLRLMFMKGIACGHRFLFFNGNMFYFSALLWFMLLVLMTVYAIANFFHQSAYFTAPWQLFPDWPVQYSCLSMQLLGVTMVFLFFPKVLSIVWVLSSGREYLFGGAWRLLLSVILETVFSIFLAPVRMVFHSWFIISSLLGGGCDWKKQSRCLKKLSLAEALKANWLVTLIAFIWGGIAFAVNQTLFLWLSIIVVPLFFSVPLAILMSSTEPSIFLKGWGLLLTPVEIKPSKEIIALKNLI